ncbi:ATP-grasp domain-containing protein [Simkania negevensis]|uniref:ATP-grasp domain-containing protein n=1 Tax=Simkania negevensis TaxID=83561 RepID=A0ABS3APG7_9BACT|nr:ATP-grasp domain-containing protein [Simkania negevensis]
MSTIVSFAYYARNRGTNLHALASAANALGFDCIVVTRRTEELSNTTFFKEVVYIDRWDLDTLDATLKQLQKRYHIKSVVSEDGIFHPDGLLGATVADLAKRHGLPSQNADALWRTNNKYLTRDALTHAGLRTIRYGLAQDVTSFQSVLQHVGLPLIIKPLCGAGSTFILKADTPEEALDHFLYAQEHFQHAHYAKLLCRHQHTYQDKSGRQISFDPLHHFLIEQYIPGREFSIECIVTEDEVLPVLIHDKLSVTQRGRVFLEHILIAPPASFTLQEIEIAKRYAIDAVKATGLQNSVIHVEMRYDSTLGPQIIEINPRIGAGAIPRSLKTMTGIDPYKAQLQLLTKQFIPQSSYPIIAPPHAMFWLFSPHSGRLKEVSGLEDLDKLPGIIDVELTYPIDSIIHGDDEECFLVQCWMQAESAKQAIDTYQQAFDAVTIDVEPTKQMTHA